MTHLEHTYILFSASHKNLSIKKKKMGDLHSIAYNSFSSLGCDFHGLEVLNNDMSPCKTSISSSLIFAYFHFRQLVESEFNIYYIYNIDIRNFI